MEADEQIAAQNAKKGKIYVSGWAFWPEYLELQEIK